MKIKPKETPNPIRQRMQSNIVGCNKYLKDVVQTMSDVALLRNTHPQDRPEFAQELYDMKCIDRETKVECMTNIRFRQPR